MRESFRQDALEVWENLTTGHHASMAEFERWLASWESDENIPAPYPA
jgi:hypothetical protein